MNNIIRFTFLTLSTISVAMQAPQGRNNPANNNPGYWAGIGRGIDLGAADRPAPAIAHAPNIRRPTNLPSIGPVNSEQVYVLGQDEAVITRSSTRIGGWIDIGMVSQTARLFLYPRYTLSYLKEGLNITSILPLKHEWPTFTKPTASAAPVILVDEITQKLLNTNSLLGQRVALKKIYITNVRFDGPENVYFNLCDETGIKEQSWLPQSWQPLTIFEGQTYKVKRTIIGDRVISVSEKEPIWFPTPTQNATRTFWVTSGAVAGSVATLLVKKGLTKIKKDLPQQILEF